MTRCCCFLFFLIYYLNTKNLLNSFETQDSIHKNLLLCPLGGAMQSLLY